jgi:hypothetical protein
MPKVHILQIYAFMIFIILTPQLCLGSPDQCDIAHRSCIISDGSLLVDGDENDDLDLLLAYCDAKYDTFEASLKQGDTTCSGSTTGLVPICESYETYFCTSDGSDFNTCYTCNALGSCTSKKVLAMKPSNEDDVIFERLRKGDRRKRLKLS